MGLLQPVGIVCTNVGFPRFLFPIVDHLYMSGPPQLYRYDVFAHVKWYSTTDIDIVTDIVPVADTKLFFIRISPLLILVTTVIATGANTNPATATASFTDTAVSP